MPESKIIEDITENTRATELPEIAKIVETGLKYPTFVDAIIAATSGQTVKLLSDFEGSGIGLYRQSAIDIGKIPSDPVPYCLTKDLILDLNGFTYIISKDMQGHGDNVCTQGIHIDSNKTDGGEQTKITIKNGTIKFAEIVESSNNKKPAMIIQNYADLTLDSLTLDGSNLTNKSPYTCSNNSGNIVVKDSTITSKTGKFAADLCYFQTYDPPKMEILGNSRIDGNIEVSNYSERPVENQIDQPELKLTSGTLNGEVKLDQYTQTSPNKPTIIVTKDFQSTFNFESLGLLVNGIPVKQKTGGGISYVQAYAYLQRQRLLNAYRQRKFQS